MLKDLAEGAAQVHMFVERTPLEKFAIAVLTFTSAYIASVYLYGGMPTAWLSVSTPKNATVTCLAGVILGLLLLMLSNAARDDLCKMPSKRIKRRELWSRYLTTWYVAVGLLVVVGAAVGVALRHALELSIQDGSSFSHPTAVAASAGFGSFLLGGTYCVFRMFAAAIAVRKLAWWQRRNEARRRSLQKRKRSLWRRNR